MRGRQFGFIGLLCTSWVAARVFFLTISADASTQETSRVAAILPAAITGQDLLRAEPARTDCCLYHAGHSLPLRIAATSPQQAHSRYQAMQGQLVSASIGPQQTGTATAPLASFPTMLPPAGANARKFPLEVYAFSFWRSGNPTPGQIGNGQYGGSQSAIIASYPLRRFKSGDRAALFSLVGRAAIAHGNSAERELAAGLRWRPSQRLPLHLTAERRFRHGRADAVAAYLAGGVSAIPLPLKFNLDGYAQGGFVSGKSGGAFADFNARADRKFGHVGPASFAAGAGIWGGGQDDIFRVDAGPSLRADIATGSATGSANFRLTGDWRFRIAGKAEPGDGPAVTLSTSF